MAFWLMKTEPDEFAYDDLARLGRDRWNGVRNFRALAFMRRMATGDLTFIYHTGKEKAIVGVAEVVAPAYPDPNVDDKRFVVVDVAPRYRLPRPVTLREIKNDQAFAAWELARLPRLSVMPVPPELWQRILDMAKITPA
ncbi:EVE domain-containing protein [Anaeroselena agilis]|uniref:EVE domain-containing protein n=1 Tax=Anaeroselena agilis TaxID=3063788 RepID=A0ABU3NSX4_9FIRM|nr:EVE domain-containing protein [Selenomonadales bacterium 4137-cl]